MASMPAESAAELREVAHAATRDFALLPACAQQRAATSVDLDAIAEFILLMLRSTARRLLRPDEFEYLLDEARAGIGDTGCITDFMQDPSLPAYTPREINAKQLVWVHLQLGPTEEEPMAAPGEFDWWGSSVRTLRNVQEAFCKRVADELTGAGFDAPEPERHDQSEAIAAFSRFLLGWLRVVCPFGEMDSLLLAVSDYGEG